MNKMAKNVPFATSEEQRYAKVLKALGNCRFNLQVDDGLNRIGIARGSMRRKGRKGRGANYIDVGSIVLISIREFQDDKVDILHVYSAEAARYLAKHGEISSLLLKDEKGGSKVEEKEKEVEGGFVFTDDLEDWKDGGELDIDGI